MSRDYNNPPSGHFGIKKSCKSLAQKYYWPTFRQNVKAYMKGYNMCLASKAVCHKPYSDLQLLPLPTHQWKNFSINFVTNLPVSIDWKEDSYNSILVIIDWLIKMILYKLVKIIVMHLGLQKFL